jgi:hypothetical protein
MPKNWVTFFIIIGIGILIITVFQFIFVFVPIKDIQLYNPAKMNPTFETGLLEKVNEFHKNQPIDNNSLEPYQYKEFTPPTKE